jgi:hypothetical protein
MDFRSERLSLAETKEIDLVDYLSSLGYQPSKIRGFNYWYLSPLRTEKTPSFKVNRKLNRWWDFGIGKGGSIVDFGMLFYGCTIPKLLQILSGILSLPQVLVTSFDKANEVPGSRIKIVGEFSLSSAALLHYLQKRKIPIAIAEKYCCEIRYELGGKTWYGIGFKNDSGGFEIRNAFFKGSSSLKDVTAIRNGANEICVFEGFIDLLSYITIRERIQKKQTDYLVLNSLTFFERARAVCESYKTIYLYLDNDMAGQHQSRYATSLSPQYMDESRLYCDHKDLNDFLLQILDLDTIEDQWNSQPP